MGYIYGLDIWARYMGYIYGLDTCYIGIAHTACIAHTYWCTPSMYSVDTGLVRV